MVQRLMYTQWPLYSVWWLCNFLPFQYVCALFLTTDKPDLIHSLVCLIVLHQIPNSMKFGPGPVPRDQEANLMLSETYSVVSNPKIKLKIYFWLTKQNPWWRAPLWSWGLKQPLVSLKILGWHCRCDTMAVRYLLSTNVVLVTVVLGQLSSPLWQTNLHIYQLRSWANDVMRFLGQCNNNVPK